MSFALIGVILLALVFDFINGFHDAANSIATIVTTKVLKPFQAVIWAAFFNFIAFTVFELHVAQTIGIGLIDTHLVTPHLIFAALVGAITWNLWTWYFGLPSSSSHALIGGLVGAAFIQGGIHALIFTGVMKVLLGMVAAASVGIVMGYAVMWCMKHVLFDISERKAQKWFKRFQLLSSACLSLTHGGNDAQKTMGVIAVLLFSTSYEATPFHVPFWVVVTCYAVMSLGTLFGGWRVVKTMGEKITLLNPMRGCAAETSSAILLFIATHFGVPMSTTQTVTGSIVGVGLLRGHTQIKWGMFSQIFWSWVFTIPASGFVAAVIYRLT